MDRCVNGPYETPGFRRIHRHDFREGCDEAPAAPRSLCWCGDEVSRELHFGVYVTRVSYAAFCSALCAARYGDLAYAEHAAAEAAGVR